MKAIDFMKALAGPNFQTEGTVDNFKYGDMNAEVTRVATCLTATPDVLRAAKEWGADLIISHEPTYYDHLDNKADDEITRLKAALVEECGIPLCRYHDYIHFRSEDMIALGFLDVMGWKGTFDGQLLFILDEAKTPLQIAKEIEEKTGLRHVRIIGKRDGEVTKLGLFLGHRGGGPDCWGQFKSLDGVEVALGGEWCEWANGEPIRDAAQLGYQATAIILGHAGSERDGMRYLAKEIRRDFESENITAEYFECGELYTYTD